MALSDEFKLRPGLVMPSMGVIDIISEGDSCFMSEIKSLNEMIDSVTKGCFSYCWVS